MSENLQQPIRISEVESICEDVRLQRSSVAYLEERIRILTTKLERNRAKLRAEIEKLHKLEGFLVNRATHYDKKLDPTIGGEGY